MTKKEEMALTRIFASVLAIAFLLSMVGQGTQAAAVTGFDSGYAGESAFLTLAPGQSGMFQVFFRNTGQQSWIKGTGSQVDLAACLEDKVTCNAQDASEAGFNDRWVSATRYSTQVQGTVISGQIAAFAYNVKVPAGATGLHRFNGELVVASGARIHPEGYYQDVTVIGPPAATPSPTPGSTHFPSPSPVIPTAKPIATATPAPTATPNPLLCFDGTTDTANGETGEAIYGGVCTKTGANSATLNNIPAGRDGAYAGVYYAISHLQGKTIGNVTSLGFTYTGSTAGAGAPRISLPVDTDGNGSTDTYLFIAAFHCNDGEGLVDAIHDTTCTIFYTGGPDSGYPNWAALVDAHPGFKVATTNLPFVIADEPGAWTVSSVHLGE